MSLSETEMFSTWNAGSSKTTQIPIEDWNEKRIRESEAIQQRLEKEKEELRQYLEEDNNKLLQNLKEQAEQHAKV